MDTIQSGPQDGLKGAPKLSGGSYGLSTRFGRSIQGGLNSIPICKKSLQSYSCAGLYSDLDRIFLEGARSVQVCLKGAPEIYFMAENSMFKLLIWDQI